MTLLNDLMTNYELDPVLAIPSIVAALSLVLAAIAVWAFVRARRVLRMLPALEERVAVLNHSMTLLTDTTESCFKALSMQLQFIQSQNPLRPSARPLATVKTRRAVAEKARGKGVAVSQNIRPEPVGAVNADSPSASIVSTFVA
jgi:hypothetical protein